MKYSKLFTKTEHRNPKDETSVNAQFLIRGGFIDKLSAGVYTLLPLGLRVFKKIEQIIREEMNVIGGQEVFMPSLHPRENWERTGRWEAMDDLFRLEAGENKFFALAPTHEEAVVPIAKRFISSYKDLPVYFYQFQNKFRNEKRAKSGLLRGREFMMKDLYSFHTDEKDLDEYYEKAKIAYRKIFDRCGIGEITYLTYASGGTFSKHSHEFQTLTEAGEDLIYICEKCRVAVNKEIIADQGGKCPECGNEDLKEEKAVETGNIFKLMTKFSAPFELDYTDDGGEKKPVVMGCYGIGLQRLLGAIVETSHDEKGIIWPVSVAPAEIHLVSIGKNDEAEKIETELSNSGLETIYDDREATPGEKFADADLIGCPFRVVVSEKTLASDSIELKSRKASDSEPIKIGDLAAVLKEKLKQRC